MIKIHRFSCDQLRAMLHFPLCNSSNIGPQALYHAFIEGEKDMRAIGNFLWFILGGVFMGLGWWLVGVLAFITIVGIPWGKACFVIGQFTFFPFGKEAVSRKELTKKDDIGTGGLGLAGNIIWFVFAGVWLAIGHVLSAIACFITIIGIPFGIQHLKLAGIALAPIGKTIVTKEVAAAARKQGAEEHVTKMRSNA
ncbi:YccF domain-containing protein [Collimonas antrihumi]|uniref:YccF domain-containing protein n=1 Tax=Collimonas antrihumi TaxID=1940615 RepID=UPI0031B8A09D